jgi:hypothetical protein
MDPAARGIGEDLAAAKKKSAGLARGVAGVLERARGRGRGEDRVTDRWENLGARVSSPSSTASLAETWSRRPPYIGRPASWVASVLLGFQAHAEESPYRLHHGIYSLAKYPRVAADSLLSFPFLLLFLLNSVLCNYV